MIRQYEYFIEETSKDLGRGEIIKLSQYKTSKFILKIGRIMKNTLTMTKIRKKLGSISRK